MKKGTQESYEAIYSRPMFIKPPEGTEFRECKICALPMVYDGNSDNCLMCEIEKDGTT